MQTLERLGAGDMVAVVHAYRDALDRHREAINRLNVYPVPDGDTGTNMALTMQSVGEAIDGADGTDVASVAAAISHGSLMGARGNSGVILSQILRGLADAVRESGGLDAAALVDGLRRAADGAYRAVETPMEGTILTVIRAAADGAGGAGAVGLVAVMEAARAAAAGALAATPDMLPVLKAAGVVDSGGTGLLLLLDSFLHVADGRPLPEPPAASPAVSAGVPGVEVAHAGEGCRYEVMYLLEAPDESIPSFRAVWAGIGDSIVVVGGEGVFNCHIHTDDIGAAVEAALEAGRPRQIRVTDLWDEVEEERWVREAAGSATDTPDPTGTEVVCAVVAVCAGEGVGRILRSLGVSRTVVGGQSMNPSTAEILDAIAEAPGQEVVVLPNNKNVIPVAEAAAAQSAKAVRVVATRNIPEGFAALLDYDPQSDAAANAASMTEASGRVVAGEVTHAVRDSPSPVGEVHAGDFIGLTRAGIVAVATTQVAAATGLLEAMLDPDHHEIVTCICGEGSTPGDTRRIGAWLEERHPGLALEVHQGGQPLYPYLFGVE